MALYP